MARTMLYKKPSAHTAMEIIAPSRSARHQCTVRTVVRVTRRYRNSRITLDYILYRRLPGLHLHCKVDWHEQNTLLKLDFPAAVNAVKATYGIQFGSIERPIHQNTLWDHARLRSAHKNGSTSATAALD